ncbi:TonB-dependent receptor [Luteimonas sp. A501]
MKLQQRRRLRMNPLMAAMIAASFVAPAVAQEQDEASKDKDPVALDAIVVTSQRKAEPITQVPMSISAFSASEIDAAAITDTQNLSMKVPGLVYLASDGFAQPYIRGVGMAFAANGLETPVATYIDDVYIQQQTGSVTQLVDLERVEVLKGPQGTLYGRNATGGAIVVKTADPTDVLEGRVKVGYGSHDTVKVEGVLNVPLSPTVSARIAAQIDERNDGYITNHHTGSDLGQHSRKTVRAKLAWRPSEATEVIASFESFRGEDTINAHKHGAPTLCTACSVYDIALPTGFFDVSVNNETPATSDADLGILRVFHDFGNYEFYSVTSYREYVYQGSFDQDFTPANLLNYNTRNASETFEQELRLQSNRTGPLNFAVGAFYERDSTDAPATLTGDSFGGLSPGSEHTYSELEAMAVFGELYYQFNDKWKLTAGGRFNSDKRSLEVVNNADGATVFGTSGFRVAETFSEFTPRVVLAYNNGNVNLYANYGKGFKSGGFNSTVFTPTDPLESEILNGFEVGGKFTLADRRVQLNTSIFHYQYDNIQVTFYDPLTSATFLRNAADSTIYGADLDLMWAATERLTVGAGLAYLDATFDSFTNGSIYVPVNGIFVVEQADLSGNTLPSAPEFSGYLSLNYARELGNGMELRLGAVANHSSEYDFLPAAGGPLALDRQEALTRVNATASYGPADGRWAVTLWAENLTDERYFNNRLATGFGDQLTMAAPRMYGAAVEWRF